MRLKSFALLFAITPAVAFTSEPMSKSMAECAGLALAVSSWMREGDSRADQLLYLAGVWSEAAVAQALEEGHSDAIARVAEHERAKHDHWVARGRMSVFSEEFRDWAAYCRALGASRGLDIDLVP